jgi:hypothetical protein
MELFLLLGPLLLIMCSGVAACGLASSYSCTSCIWPSFVWPAYFCYFGVNVLVFLICLVYALLHAAIFAVTHHSTWLFVYILLKLVIRGQFCCNSLCLISPYTTQIVQIVRALGYRKTSTRIWVTKLYVALICKRSLCESSLWRWRHAFACFWSHLCKWSVEGPQSSCYHCQFWFLSNKHVCLPLCLSQCLKILPQTSTVSLRMIPSQHACR